jgi:hypothetical protein
MRAARALCDEHGDGGDGASTSLLENWIVHEPRDGSGITCLTYIVGALTAFATDTQRALATPAI